MADIHRLSSEERRIYLSDAMSSCADEQDYSIMHRSKRARMDNYDEGISSSSQNGDIFDSDDEKEHSSEEESNSEENENSDEGDSKEESEEHESSEDGEDYDPWQTLIHEAKLQLKKDPIHKKIMQTRDNLIDVDFLDREEALYSAVEKRKFLFKRLLEKRQHYSDDESDINE